MRKPLPAHMNRNKRRRRERAFWREIVGEIAPAIIAGVVVTGIYKSLFKEEAQNP